MHMTCSEQSTSKALKRGDVMHVPVEFRKKIYEANHISREKEPELRTGHLIGFSAEHVDDMATLGTVGIIEQEDGWLTKIPVEDIRLAHKDGHHE